MQGLLNRRCCQGTWVSGASIPCHACPAQPEKGSQTPHRCGQSEKRQAPRCGQIGHSRSPHSPCQAPSDLETLTPVQGSGPAAGLAHLYGYTEGSVGLIDVRIDNFVSSRLSLTTEVPPCYTVAISTWYPPPGHQEAVRCDVLEAQF